MYLPLLSKNSVTEHHVIDDVIYRKGSNLELCESLESILIDIYTAIECAADKKTRSAIRENLLKAVIKINDQLLPEPMESYIQKQMSSASA